MNYQELLQAVRDYTNRPRLTDSTLSLWFRAVEGDCNRTLRHPRMIARVDMTLTAAANQVVVPSDLLQIKVLAINNVVQKQNWVPSTDGLTAPGYVLRGDAIQFPSELPVDTKINLDYYAAVMPLSGQAPENWLSRLFPDAYIYGSLKQAAVYLKDNASMEKWNALYAQVIDGINAQGWGSDVAEAPRIVYSD